MSVVVSHVVSFDTMGAGRLGWHAVGVDASDKAQPDRFMGSDKKGRYRSAAELAYGNTSFVGTFTKLPFNGASNV